MKQLGMHWRGERYYYEDGVWALGSIGQIVGSDFDLWDGMFKSTELGPFATEAEAKRAVEHAWANDFEGASFERK